MTMRSATSDTASAAASVSMWPASEISASEFASTPATTSAIMNATISASALATRRGDPLGGGGIRCEWWW